VLGTSVGEPLCLDGHSVVIGGRHRHSPMAPGGRDESERASQKNADHGGCPRKERTRAAALYAFRTRDGRLHGPEAPQDRDRSFARARSKNDVLRPYINRDRFSCDGRSPALRRICALDASRARA